MRDVTLPLLALAGVAALSGCGTSSATFSSDLDQYQPPGGVVTKPVGPIVFTQAPTRTIPTHHLSPTEGPVYGATSGPALDDLNPDTNLEFVNPALKSKLAVVRVGSDRSDSNLLTVFAGVRNKSAKPLDIEVQTIYKDKSGTPLTDGKGGWIPITLKPHGETQYRSMAISEDATDYVVRIRHADDTPPPGQ